ncbi:GNAT family N-acetyltransferase [Dinoroseobacter sp. S76]|uniref:GNAT family N-acetyltransferase n=1 Tax=Dinoroseobacter sp. S76 TaxID=3415124 RepID=UPI003C7BA66E
MTAQPCDIRELTAADLARSLEDLCEVLRASVLDGAAIGFMATLSAAEAQRFWRDQVGSLVAAQARVLLGAFDGERLVGTVQVILAMPPNQPHRAEVAKMMVHPHHRRRRIGQALMAEALARAAGAGKTLVTLDTRTGDTSESFYREMGFQRAGVMPDYALDPDGQARHATTFMYRYI